MGSRPILPVQDTVIINTILNIDGDLDGHWHGNVRGKQKDDGEIYCYISDFTLKRLAFLVCGMTSKYHIDLTQE